ncbi:MAG: hypothetical protein R3E64_03675 [Halioglobus sp.]
MSVDSALPEYPHNPYYGNGVYRRRIRLTREDDRVHGELEDDCHGFRVTLQHDGHAVTAVAGDALRVPLTTCAGALTPLQALIGVALDASLPSILAQVKPRNNCTHWYDLSLLALAHATQREPVRVYDVEVDDQPAHASAARAEVFLNGQSVHRWQLDRNTIVEPPAYAGRPVLNGFSAWAYGAFDGAEREAAFVLSKGVFVAFSRMFDMRDIGGQPALAHTNMLGACYSYSPGVVEQALRQHGMVRDFSTTPEQLLHFK